MSCIYGHGLFCRELFIYNSKIWQQSCILPIHKFNFYSYRFDSIMYSFILYSIFFLFCFVSFKIGLGIISSFCIVSICIYLHIQSVIATVEFIHVLYVYVFLFYYLLFCWNTDSLNRIPNEHMWLQFICISIANVQYIFCSTHDALQNNGKSQTHATSYMHTHTHTPYNQFCIDHICLNFVQIPKRQNANKTDKTTGETIFCQIKCRRRE